RGCDGGGGCGLWSVAVAVDCGGVVYRVAAIGVDEGGVAAVEGDGDGVAE
nr:hypothetical protein [Tanacetum cinerariifolium]